MMTLSLTIERWLEEPVFWNNIEYISRRTAIVRLCVDGLIPFIEKNGYCIRILPQELYKRIAKGLFLNQRISTVVSKWSFSPIENPCTLNEHRAHFYHIVNPYKWENFWKRWGMWSDVSLEYEYGWHRQIDIQEYIWTQLDLDLSPQTQVVNEHLGLVDEAAMEDNDNRDNYIKDMAESNEWAGYRR